MRCDKEQKAIADRLFVRWCVARSIPLRIYRHEEFQDLLYHLSQGSYSGPGSDRAIDAIQSEFVNQTRDNIKVLLADAKRLYRGKSFLAIYFDGWTDSQGVHWLGVFCTWLHPRGWVLRTACLGIHHLQHSQVNAAASRALADVCKARSEAERARADAADAGADERAMAEHNKRCLHVAALLSEDLAQCYSENFAHTIEHVILPLYGLSLSDVKSAFTDNCGKEAAAARQMDLFAHTCHSHTLALCMGHACIPSKDRTGANNPKVARNNDAWRPIHQKLERISAHFHQSPAGTKGLDSIQMDAHKSGDPFMGDRPANTLRKTKKRRK